MNQLKVFENEQFGQIRVSEVDGEPMFVAADVCKALDISKHRDAVSRLDDDERGSVEVDTLGGVQNVVAVTESGLYALVLGSRKPEAKEFKRWVTHDVIPSIRKHGAYMTQETIEAAILNPDYLLKVVTALKDETDKRKALEAVNSELSVDLTIAKPKADYFDELVERNLLTNFRETSKELGVKQNTLVSFLLDKKYIYRDKKGKLLPYEAKNDGLFEVKECFNEKTKWSGTQTMVTPKGRETFRLLCIS